jgi:hypothetical protein
MPISKKYHWTGNLNFTTGEVTNCKLSTFDRPFEAYCLGHHFKMEGSGTIAKNTQVDFWSETWSDEKWEVIEEIDIITERGSKSVPIQERVTGRHHNRTYHYEVEWWEHREWFDFSEAKIDPTVFNVPAGCPQYL